MIEDMTVSIETEPGGRRRAYRDVNMASGFCRCDDNLSKRVFLSWSERRRKNSCQKGQQTQEPMIARRVWCVYSACISSHLYRNVFLVHGPGEIKHSDLHVVAIKQAVAQVRTEDCDQKQPSLPLLLLVLGVACIIAQFRCWCNVTSGCANPLMSKCMQDPGEKMQTGGKLGHATA